MIAATLKGIVDTKHPDLVQIQECRRFTTRFGDQVDSVTPTVESLERLGYEAMVQRYNEGGGDKAFQFITAYDPATFKFKRSFIRYLTQTPLALTARPDTNSLDAGEKKLALNRIRDHNFGPEWERCVFVCEFKHKQIKAPVFAINVHLDIATDYRLKATQLMVEFVREILAQSPDAKIIMTGDFNVLPEADRKGAEQLEIVNGASLGGDKLLHEATSKLLLPDGQLAAGTFIPFPYDLFGMKPGVDLSALVKQLSTKEHRKEASAALSNFDGQAIDQVRFLASLEPVCRKAMVRLLFEKSCALGGILDRVFHRGFDASAQSVLLPAPIFIRQRN